MGLLGLAGMSIRSLTANDSSGYRAAAALQAMQISDLMRANRQSVVDNAYDVAYGATAGSSTRATNDIAAWKAAIARLPSGDGTIAYAAANGTVTVTVRWDDRRGNQGSSETNTLQTYAYSFRI
jgi:type IV pilus assembly protein PilV